MADELEDDQWLYGEAPDLNIGDAPNESQIEEEPSPGGEAPAPTLVTQAAVEDDGPPGVDNHEQENGQEDGVEDGEVRQNGDDSEKEDLEDDSDDDVNVVIGDIKATAPSYTSLNIKRGGLLTSVGDKTKPAQQQQQPGKFSVEEFDQIGTINGVPPTEYNLDSLEDKPWRKPGADITDYFNYGFNEDTWRAYCERQKRMRVNESGVGLAPMNPIGMPRGPVPIMNDNSKYAGNFLGMRKAGPPPFRKLTGGIDVIGGSGSEDGTPDPQQGRTAQDEHHTVLLQQIITVLVPKQVMTADRREYSRKPAAFPDLTVPPPATFENFQPEYGFNPEPEPFYGGYEPTQDSQWGTEAEPSWTPSDLKTLTGPPPMGPPPVHMGPPPMVAPVRMSSPRREGSPHKESRDRDRDRDRDREVSRSRSEKPRDRERERSHRRERSRSRSRRHKSRSRSPSHRSHRKKKSRRHEDSD
ncbi:hypothetical protein NQ315_016360 [Exocentrus adspersus]|uniref:Pre-mRNA polyadenylation factor Fip1 domain-containing protein n=1 Tax=Exocentrus adspersus TaxID=1586481 RepID=A0AAV8VQG9_9CUCU|nr:hypothetical protein NQ315_016360 [Exocentrus adspersus]